MRVLPLPGAVPVDRGIVALATRDALLIVATRPAIRIAVRLPRRAGDGDMLPTMDWCNVSGAC